MGAASKRRVPRGGSAATAMPDAMNGMRKRLGARIFAARVQPSSRIGRRPRRFLHRIPSANLHVRHMDDRMFSRFVAKAAVTTTNGIGRTSNPPSRSLRRPPRLTLHRLVQIPIGLQPHPELRRRLQQSCEPQRGVRGDPALSEDNLVQPVERDAQALGRLELPETERLQVLLQQDLARWNRRPQPVRDP